MEQIMNYVKPELIVVAVVLYFCGITMPVAKMLMQRFIETGCKHIH